MSQYVGERDFGGDCERCARNGEIVTDWQRYKHPRAGDMGDEAVTDCPDCGGSGRCIGALPDIEQEGERLASETWRHPSGMYLWTDLVGAIQTAIAEERARHAC